MNLLEVVNLIVIFVVAITIHEYSHAVVAHKLGDPTAKQEGRLTLNPIAHIDPLTTLALPILLILAGSPVIFGAARPVPFAPHMVRGGKKGVALIALAGPGSNILLACFVALLIRLSPGLATAGNGLFISLMMVNIALALFNLLPVPPLDGSRILYAFVPSKIQDAMEHLERTGPIIILIIFLVGYPFISPYLGTATQGLARFLLGV